MVLALLLHAFAVSAVQYAGVHSSGDLLRHDQYRSLAVVPNGKAEPAGALMRSNVSQQTSAGSAPQGGACHTECSADSTHCVYINALPADFCSATGQANWCTGNIGKPWCICKWAYKNFLASKNRCTALSVDKGKSGKSNNDFCYICGSYTNADKAYECLGCSSCGR